MIKNEINWWKKAEDEFGVDVVDEWCGMVDLDFLAEDFDESCYNGVRDAVLHGEV